MNEIGRVEHVHIAPEAGAEMVAVDLVEAVAGKGLRGDRYFEDAGTWSSDPHARDVARDITLFEVETLDVVSRDADIALTAADHRRNLTVSGIGLDHLLGDQFRIGSATFKAIELCEPCAHLESLVGQEGVLEALVHRGGLNAAVIETGEIAVGDAIVIE